MAGTLPRCRALYDAWRAQAASALPAQLTAQHTEAAVALPGWAAMEKCVVEQGRAVGVEPAQTLAHVERAGPWIRAVDTVNPLREKLQRSFLPGGVAKTQDEMGIDELRVAQVYVYGLAQHLADCRAHATGVARSAGLSNPDMPLKDYDEERWDPRLAEWQRMELCVHAAAQAGSGSVDAAWRAGYEEALDGTQIDPDGDGPMWSLTLYAAPSAPSSALLYAANHAISDQISQNRILTEARHGAAELRAGRAVAPPEPLPLPPSVEGALVGEPLPPLEPKQRAEVLIFGRTPRLGDEPLSSRCARAVFGTFFPST